MKDTKKKIMNASIKQFVKKGYIEATTIEIAKAAGVAEVTIFRNFNSKFELFEKSLRHALSVVIDESKIDVIVSLPTEQFYKKLLFNRIQIAKKKQKLLMLIIKESFSNHLPKDLQFTEIIYSHIKEVIEKHSQYYNLKINSENKARIIAGILLSIVIIPGKFNQTEDEIIGSYLPILI
ncbi:MAG: TetR/AcrR family transcriptional regulator [Candidatus Izimaplasma sp.]|nr:TetR/AcrR family transcriptional regulator [Candidatus Izimaplasma bacterium]